MRRVSFFIEDDLEQGLDEVYRRDGVRKAESIRRAIAAYLEAKKVLKPASTARYVERRDRKRR